MLTVLRQIGSHGSPDCGICRYYVGAYPERQVGEERNTYCVIRFSGRVWVSAAPIVVSGDGEVSLNAVDDNHA